MLSRVASGRDEQLHVCLVPGERQELWMADRVTAGIRAKERSSCGAHLAWNARVLGDCLRGAGTTAASRCIRFPRDTRHVGCAGGCERA